MSKPTVPKSIDEWPSITDRPIGVSSRIVPDNLLRERFAFAGEVKLTREEAEALLSCFKALEAYPITEENKWAANKYVRFMERKLSAAQAEPKACEHDRLKERLAKCERAAQILIHDDHVFSKIIFDYGSVFHVTYKDAIDLLRSAVETDGER